MDLFKKCSLWSQMFFLWISPLMDVKTKKNNNNNNNNNNNHNNNNNSDLIVFSKDGKRDDYRVGDAGIVAQKGWFAVRF